MAKFPTKYQISLYHLERFVVAYKLVDGGFLDPSKFTHEDFFEDMKDDFPPFDKPIICPNFDFRPRNMIKFDILSDNNPDYFEYAYLDKNARGEKLHNNIQRSYRWATFESICNLEESKIPKDIKVDPISEQYGTKLKCKIKGDCPWNWDNWYCYRLVDKQNNVLTVFLKQNTQSIELRMIAREILSLQYLVEEEAKTREGLVKKVTLDNMILNMPNGDNLEKHQMAHKAGLSKSDILKIDSVFREDFYEIVRTDQYEYRKEDDYSVYYQEVALVTSGSSTYRNVAMMCPQCSHVKHLYNQLRFYIGECDRFMLFANKDSLEERIYIGAILDRYFTYSVLNRLDDLNFGESMGTTVWQKYRCTSKSKPEDGQFCVRKFDVSMEKEHLMNMTLSDIGLYARVKPHPYILKYTHFYEKGETVFYLRTPIIEDNLSSYIERVGKLKDVEMRKFSTMILEALEYLHRNGSVHGDLKGPNVLLDANRKVLLTDWGYSRNLIHWRFKTLNRDLRRFKDVFNWTCPEVLRRDLWEHKADIWSFGATMVEMATGKLPFPNMDNAQVLSALRSFRRYDFSEPINEEVRSIIDSCMKMKAEDRPTSKELLRNHYFIRTCEM